MFWFNPLYLIFISPALLLMLWAQYRVKSSYGRAMQIPAPIVRHVYGQQRAERQQKTDDGRAVQPQPPDLGRARRVPECPWSAQPVMAEEPPRARQQQQRAAQVQPALMLMAGAVAEP